MKTPSYVYNHLKNNVLEMYKTRILTKAVLFYVDLFLSKTNIVILSCKTFYHYY